MRLNDVALLSMSSFVMSHWSLQLSWRVLPWSRSDSLQDVGIKCHDQSAGLVSYIRCACLAWQWVTKQITCRSHVSNIITRLYSMLYVHSEDYQVLSQILKNAIMDYIAAWRINIWKVTAWLVTKSVSQTLFKTACPPFLVLVVLWIQTLWGHTPPHMSWDYYHKA